MPTIQTGSSTGLRSTLYSRSVPMLPGPIRAHLIFSMGTLACAAGVRLRRGFKRRTPARFAEVHGAEGGAHERGVVGDVGACGVDVEPVAHGWTVHVDGAAAQQGHELVAQLGAAAHHLRGLKTVTHAVRQRDFPPGADRSHHLREGVQQHGLHFKDGRLRARDGVEGVRVKLGRPAGVGRYALAGDGLEGIQSALQRPDRGRGNRPEEHLREGHAIQRPGVELQPRTGAPEAIEMAEGAVAPGTKARSTTMLWLPVPCRPKTVQSCTIW